MMEHVRFHPCFVTETVHSETEKHRSVSWLITQYSTVDVWLSDDLGVLQLILDEFVTGY